MSVSRMLRVLLAAFLALFVAFPAAAARAPIMTSASYQPARRRAATPYVHPRMHRHRRRRSQSRKTSRAFSSGIPVAQSVLRRAGEGFGLRVARDAHPPDHPPA